jgi:Bacterial Ig-like domain (group 1)
VLTSRQLMVKMMRKHAWFLGTLAAALVMSGCGGNGGASSFAGNSSSSSSSSSSGGPTATVAAITLVSSSPQIQSDGSTPATITAIATNSSNVVVPGATVSFSSTSGALTMSTTTTGVTPGITDANGEAAATLGTPGNTTNRNITVTATAGTISATVTVAVVGTKISLTGPSSLIQGASGTFSASLTDSGGNGIAGATVAAVSAKGNTLSASSLVTDSTGHVTFTVTGTVAGADTVSISALGMSASQALSVSSQNFAFSAPAANTLVPLNTPQALTLVWTNAGAPVTGQPVTFSTTRGLFSSGATTITVSTDGTGTAIASLSSTTAGPAIITASGSGVSGQINIVFVATVAASLDLQASPAVIPTAGSSTITAIVRDAQNNLVEGQTVDFQLTDKTGGAISVGTAVTGIQGTAQTVYTATSTASTSNGVQVTATVQGSSPSIQDTVNLTVGGQTVFLSLGTGATITENTAKTQFTVPFVIQALDSGGNAVTGVAVSLTVHSLPPTGAPALAGPFYDTTGSYAAYRKGQWQNVTEDPSCPVAWCQIVTVDCLNEDVAGTGIYNASEDLNGNGVLDPGDVAAVSPGTVTTDSTGSANVSVTYPEDHALWVQVVLTATATVTGTQTSTTSIFWLPIASTYVTTSTQSPPGVNSPYGGANSCANPH